MEASRVGTVGRESAARVGWGAGLEAGDPETVAAVVAFKDAQQARRDARVRREAAHQERVSLQQRQVDKLRELAGNALWSGMFQAAVGVATSATSVAGGLSGIAAARAERQLETAARTVPVCKAGGFVESGGATGGALAKQTEGVDGLRRAGTWSDAAGKMLGALAQGDPLRIASAGVEREKAALQVDLERANQRAETASEALAEANRQQGSVLGLLQRTGEARAQGWAAAVR